MGNPHPLPSHPSVQQIRKRLGLSQQQFAKRFGFPVRTLQQWEQGRSQPSVGTQSFLLVIYHEPEAVLRALEHQSLCPPQ